MIKAIILDVDGVIVGEKAGFNFPYPHALVNDRLKKIHAAGMPVSLCSAKSHFSITKIIADAGLNNLHITDGGAVIIDPLSGLITGKHFVPTETAQEVIQFFATRDTYVEVYTTENWYIHTTANQKYADQHTAILQKDPIKVHDLAAAVKPYDITKILLITHNMEDKEKHIDLLQRFTNKVQVSWTNHPSLLPAQFAIITAPGVSKRNGALEIAKSTGISLEETLGVGDNASDWQFMELCGYVAAMGNGTQELKEFVQERGAKGFIGGGVDENGILGIFDHFSL
jgi:hydroxymethylpyrimidine pyrophosphatase-like HAD family hydrolase